MGTLRALLSISSIAGIVFLAGSASSGSPIEHLISGTASPQGDGLVAGDHGARYELRGGTIVDVAPGSEFSFEPSKRIPLGRRGEPDRPTRVVHLMHGSVDVTVPATKRDPTALMVRGPGKMSSVTRAGTSTFLAADDRSTAACRTGDMLVGVGNDWRPLKQGFARTLAPENPAAVPRPVLAPPAPSFDRSLLFMRGSESGSAEARWQPVKNAASYDVRISRVDEKASVVVSHESTNATREALRSLAPGKYSIVVASVDKYGLPGAPSEPKTLRVAGLELPEGAVVKDDGTVVLAKEQRVRLLGSEGLEVSYGTSRFFASAPTTLGLAHDESVVARLRAPGSPDETVIRLEPKGLRAKVQVSPRAAFWPTDSVNVTIDLYDASGRAVPDGVDVKPTVTINLEPVKLDWRRHGRSLQAAVPPSAAPGPWIIRAEVRDGRGELLGRDFLEVAKSESRGVAGGVANR